MVNRVVLVISSLAMGGAESVLAWLARGLDGRGFSVAVLTLDDGSAPPFYPLPASVRHRALGLAGRSANCLAAVFGNLRRIRALRAAIDAESPDVVVSFMEQTNVLTLLAAGRRYPVVVSERVHPSNPIGRVWAWLRRRTYGRSATLVVQTGSIARAYGWLRHARVRVIPNAVLPPDRGEPTVRFSGHALVGMGRLGPQKGFDLLLRAFAAVARRFPQWHVVIFGEGRERAGLEALARELGVSERVAFPGRTPTPHIDLSQGDIFVFPSRFEGFPNALAEAMAVGLPCVAADCPGGPADLITDGENGLLVPVDDGPALERALERLMEDRGLRERLGAAAQAVVERFGTERVLGLWEQCLEEAAGAVR